MNLKLPVTIRPLTADDQPLLWEMLYLSLHVTDGDSLFGRYILDQPEIARYASEWGRAGDIGFVAMDDDEPIGAAWSRLFPADEGGYGYVDDLTPELGMAVVSDYRGKGIGSRLLEHLLEETGKRYKQISLSVSAENPAVRLYERFGFEIVSDDAASLTMLKRLTL